MGGVSCFKSIDMMRRPGPNPLSFSYHPSAPNYYIYIHSRPSNLEFYMVINPSPLFALVFATNQREFSCDHLFGD